MKKVSRVSWYVGINVENVLLICIYSCRTEYLRIINPIENAPTPIPMHIYIWPESPTEYCNIISSCHYILIYGVVDHEWSYSLG